VYKDNYWRRARLKSVIDGDTVRLVIDLGYRCSIEYAIRLERVVSPKFYRGFPEEERRRGLQARNLVVAWFRDHNISCSNLMDKWPLSVVTSKADSGGSRYVGRIYCKNDHCLNDFLLESGLVRAYVDEYASSC
jgi:hypothetical protein